MAMVSSCAPHTLDWSLAPALHGDGSAYVAAHLHIDLTAAVPSPAVHHFVELRVHTMLESDMAHAFLTDSNEGMTATDTQKNCVYYVAKQAGR